MELNQRLGECGFVNARKEELNLETLEEIRLALLSVNLPEIAKNISLNPSSGVLIDEFLELGMSTESIVDIMLTVESIWASSNSCRPLVGLFPELLVLRHEHPGAPIEWLAGFPGY